MAGDGYAYVPYVSYTGNTCPGVGTTKLSLLRMDTSGGYSSIILGTWNTFCTGSSGTVAVPTSVNVITDADQGVFVSWALQTAPYSPNYGTESTTYYVAVTNGASVIAQGPTTKLVQPVLQGQDGSFYGTDSDGMIKFDRSGNIQWSVPNDSPQIATADGGVVGASGITYDNNGRADGQTESTVPPLTNCQGGSCPVADLASSAQSWSQNTYQLGSVENTLTLPAAPATPPYASFRGSNQSSNGTSPLCRNGSDKIVAQYGQYAVVDAFFQLFLGGTPKQNNWPRFVPSCFGFSTEAHSANYSFAMMNPNNTWALVKYPLVAPASDGYGLDDWLYQYGQPRTINSGYRTPAHNLGLNPPGAPSSRHMFGDAIDFASVSHTLAELVDMNDAALAASADFVEDPAIMKTYCAKEPYPCAHADWRRHAQGAWVLP